MAQAITHQTRVEILEAFNWGVPAEWRQPTGLLLCNNDPSIQLRLLEQVQAGWVAADSMNLWIEIQRAALEQVVAQTDLLFLNDAEALAFTDAASLDAAGAALLAAGPRFVVIKRGAKGATLFHADGDARIPAHPARQFIDPTGAGDTFAGGACGWLAERAFDAETLVEALHHGAALASATVEGLGTTALLALTAEEAARRRAALG
jgi:sugar/nucleoside kinase (ribokinase family)